MAEKLLHTDITATTFRDDAASAELPERARIVVVGGGVVGTSIALHLAEAGERDVVLLERHRIASGTSWHAAGLVVRARGTHALTTIADRSVGIYAGLEERTGVEVGFNRCGSLTLATTPGRWDELRYGAGVARHHGIDVEEIGPSEVEQLWPIAQAEGVVGALHQPGDGHLNPGMAALALAKAAHAAGVRVHEGATVLEVERDARGVTGVRTDRGTIACEHVVLACGLWTRDLAWAAGAAVPLYAAEHVHVSTGDIDGVVSTLPVLREPDSYFYARHNGGGLMIGAFEPNGIPRSTDSIGANFAFGEFPPDWDHFAPVRTNAERRIPALSSATWERFLNAPESFTPDANFCLGETNEIDRLWVAAGFNSQGIIFGPGAGAALAAWITSGVPQDDVSEVDVRRFAREQSNRRYLHARTFEGLGRLYAMHWPGLEAHTARDVRRGVLYDRLRDARACFGEANGWERPMWFAPPGVEPVTQYSYQRPNWFPYVAEEHMAARESAALFDLSSFAKIDVAGPDALAVVQSLCTRDCDVAVGRVTYTLMLNERGGIELDGTVVRLAEDRYRIITPTVAHAKTLGMLRRETAGRAAAVFDATSGHATLALMGPASRAILQSITPDNISGAAFPFGTAQELELGTGYALALRVSFVGELGFELYPTTDQAPALFDALVAAGADHGLRLAGYHALNSLRCEKGFRHLWHDIGVADDPYQASMEWLLSADTGFRGKDALSAAHAPERRLRLIRLDDPDPLLLHGETVFRDRQAVGFVTSGGYGHAIGAACGLAMLAADAPSDSEYTVDVGGTLVPATVADEPWHDPTAQRMRA